VPLVDAGGCVVDVGGCELVVVVWDVGVCAGGCANAAAGTPSRAAAAIAVVQRDVEPFISQILLNMSRLAIREEVEQAKYHTPIRRISQCFCGCARSIVRNFYVSYSAVLRGRYARVTPV
jgi:hypothetical protein